jgi:hypothetical protein
VRLEHEVTMTPPLSRRRSRYVKCKLCGLVLPAWLRIPNKPESSMLLYHLGAHHLVEVKPYLKRMETECTVGGA